MAEYKEIGTISIVTDTETGQEKIGDVSGGFDSIQLKEYIKQYGPEDLLKTMAWMNFQIWETHRELNVDSDMDSFKTGLSGC